MTHTYTHARTCVSTYVYLGHKKMTKRRILALKDSIPSGFFNLCMESPFGGFFWAHDVLYHWVNGNESRSREGNLKLHSHSIDYYDSPSYGVGDDFVLSGADYWKIQVVPGNVRSPVFYNLPTQNGRWKEDELEEGRKGEWKELREGRRKGKKRGWKFKDDHSRDNSKRLLRSN